MGAEKGGFRCPVSSFHKQDSIHETENSTLATPVCRGNSSVGKTMGKVFLFLILLASVGFSASCVDSVSNIILTEQGGNIAIVLMLTVMVIAIAYMIGSATGNPRATIFAKDELYHLGISLLLLVGFTGIVGFSCQVMDYFYVSTFEQLGNLSCYIEGRDLGSVSKCYIKLAKNDADQIAKQYLKENIDNQMFSTFSITIQIPLLDAFTSSADAYKKVYAQQYDMVLNSFIIPALLSLSMQKILLEFITDNVIKWVIPIAFLFRVFFPTRQMGNFLIALAVGLYVLIPFMYTFNLAMYDIVSLDCANFSGATNDIVFGGGCSIYGFWNVGRLMPQAFFLPNLTLALFITFMGAINKALRVIG
jgi:hypothetical protein